MHTETLLASSIAGGQALQVRTKTPHIILDRIEQSRIWRSKGGEHDVVVYWTLENARALVELGFPDIPTPILRDYEWPATPTPFDHQKVTSSFLSAYDRAFCFSEQGTAKTASCIWAADYLMNEGRVNRVLVLCPLSTIHDVWQGDLFKFAMHRQCTIAYGTAEKRRKAIASNAEFVIINHDGAHIVEKEIKAGGFDLIIVDEATAYKNANTRRWKVLNHIAKAAGKCWMLTGTPAAQSPMDAFGLARIINDESPRYFNAFRDIVMTKKSRFSWEPRPGSDKLVHQYLQPAIRFEKKDCLDLPPVTFMDREAPLTAQQQKYYRQLKKELLIETQGESISAVNAAAKLGKLLQISGGAVYTESGNVVEFDVSNRIRVVQEIIEETDHKVLVFVPYTHTIELLREQLILGLAARRLAKGAGSGQVEVINGAVPAAKRGEIIHRFQTTDSPGVLILQPKAAAHGITLTAADTIIWYSPVTSVETYLQANARIDRPGQHHPMTIFNIHGSPVERRLYNLLRDNIANHNKIIDLYREEMEA
jgi:SNF2 family DNA or RNA helicase